MCSKKKILIERIIEHQIESYHDYNIIKKTLSKKNIIKKTINTESCNWDESICRTLYHFPLLINRSWYSMLQGIIMTKEEKRVNYGDF
jgi:hypothetical protein